MRRLLALLVLVPFAAVVVLSCDDHPTAPEEVQAATTVQESSAPQAAVKPPALPTPVLLAGLSFTKATITATAGQSATFRINCPPGKAPITGGLDCRDAVYGGSGPEVDPGSGGVEYGWRGTCRNETDADVVVQISVMCVDFPAQ